MVRLPFILFATAVVLLAAPLALPGNALAQSTGGSQAGTQRTTETGATLKSVDTGVAGETARSGSAAKGAAPTGQAEQTPEPSSKGGK